MTRFAYALLWWLATPVVLARLSWRSRRQRSYMDRLGERFGHYAPAAAMPRIWIHAVSVGETRAAVPLIEAFLERHPDHRVLLTHMTPTGRATGEALFGERVERAWLPYDHRFAARRFLEHFKPRLGILVETEIWPRLIEEARARDVPVVLVNARLSERSARRYARVPGMAKWALRNLAGIAAQTRADAQRFVELGSDPPAVIGNVKFDLEIPATALTQGREFRQRFGTDRSIWVAGSTREGEEALLVDAFAALAHDPAALLVIVPRHPQRFDEVVSLVRDKGLRVERRSTDAPIAPDVRVVVGDSMGEMLSYYASGDVAIMGGSFLAYGSQNLIEPCALGKPVIVGPSTYNFEEAADGAIGAGAALRVRDATEAMQMAKALAADPERLRAMGEKAREFVNAHRGAVDRLVAWLEPRLAPLSARARD